MLIRKFLENWENLKTEIVFCRVVIVLLILSILGLQVFGSEEKTIIMPPEIDKTFWVKSDSVSSEYLEEMALFFTALVLNVSPANVDYQHKAFLKYVDPGQYGLIRTRLNTKAKRIKRDGLSQVFSPIKPEIQGNQVIVRGKSRIFVGSQQTRVEDKAYKVTFIIRKGRVYVSDFIDMLADSDNS